MRIIRKYSYSELVYFTEHPQGGCDKKRLWPDWNQANDLLSESESEVRGLHHVLKELRKRNEHLEILNQPILATGPIQPT